MFYSLNGYVESYENNQIEFVVDNVGYSVFMSSRNINNICDKELTKIYIQSVVKETEFSLYGFENQQEKKIFNLLINISGVGPKTALNLLEMPVEKFVAIIKDKNEKELVKVKGIGPKAASNIILELYNNLKSFEVAEYKLNTNADIHDKKIFEALSRIGIGHSQAKLLLDKIPGYKDLMVSDVIKQCLIMNINN